MNPSSINKTQPAQPQNTAGSPAAPQVATRGKVTGPAPAYNQRQTSEKKPAQKTKSNPASTQNMLQIAEIRDGIVIMGDGSFRSVVMVKSINFDLMSPQEQESVEAGYQAFLNSLYFDIQIFMRSQKVDIRPYIDRLDKIRSESDNMLLSLLMEDYIAYISDLSTQSNIMDKYFYVVVPYYSKVSVKKAFSQSKDFFGGLASIFGKAQQGQVVVDERALEDAKIELQNRVSSVVGGLEQCGVKAAPLDTQELIELYYDFYNPDTATRQQLHNFDDVSATVVTKGKGRAPQPNLDRETN